MAQYGWGSGMTQRGMGATINWGQAQQQLQPYSHVGKQLSGSRKGANYFRPGPQGSAPSWFQGWGGEGGIGGLIGMQRGVNAENRALSEADWAKGQGMLSGVMPGYESDPMNQGSRRLAQGLLDNPEAINDQTQGLIRNRLMNTLGAQAESSRRRQMGVLANRGQLNPAAIGRMNERLGAQEDTALSRAMADTEIQRALRRNQDIQGAAGLGRQLGMDKAGVNMDVSRTFLENMPERLPEDLSGMAAMLYGGGGAGGRMGIAGAGQRGPSQDRRMGGGMGGNWNYTDPRRASPGQPGYTGYGNAGSGGTRAQPGWYDPTNIFPEYRGTPEWMG